MHQISWSCNTGSSEPSDETTRNQNWVTYSTSTEITVHYPNMTRYNSEDGDAP